MTFIRTERPADYAAIREINEAAFESHEEADIVDTLRQNCSEALSLVAVADDDIVAHILFTPTTIQSDERELKGMGLAPMAVRPEYQRQGFGSRLVRKGSELLRRAGCPYIVVLGHPDYYPRFGFERASTHGIVPEFDGVPDEAFMIKLLNPRIPAPGPGMAKYRPEFT